MSNELYYRGSSSYEVAVKNRLSALEAQGAMTTHAIQDMSAEVNGAIRQSTYTILASQQALARTFAHGFNALNNTLMIGFDVMGAKLDAMSDAICSKLDAIHDILNNPLLTASRELYRRALTNYQKGYFEEALEDCKAAVEKNKTDFISWTLLGQIYLFGAGKFSNVIDLNKAEESFFTAAKYIDADIGHSDEANRLASEIYYYLGYTKLIKSNDLLVANNTTESNSKLIEAENSSKRAFSISKENLIAGYEQAKELHFLGNDGEAMRIIEELIRADKNYALKASCDKNFESLWGKIDELVTRLRDEIAEEVTRKVETILADGERRLKEVENEVANLGTPPSYDEASVFFVKINPEGAKTYSEQVKEEGKLLPVKYALARLVYNDYKKITHENTHPMDTESSPYGSMESDIASRFANPANYKNFLEEYNSLQSQLTYSREHLNNSLKKYESVSTVDYFSALDLLDEVNSESASKIINTDLIENTIPKLVMQINVAKFLIIAKNKVDRINKLVTFSGIGISIITIFFQFLLSANHPYLPGIIAFVGGAVAPFATLCENIDLLGKKKAGIPICILWVCGAIGMFACGHPGVGVINIIAAGWAVISAFIDD